jgi:ferric-dicitrate binding protein FerR (iron transport regulator)
VEVLYSFEGRSPVSRDVRVEAGEVLVRVLAETPYEVRTAALTVEPETGSAVLAGARDGIYHVACYHGGAVVRNVRIRGQTVVRLAPGHHFTFDDGASLAYLEQRSLPDEWRRWERPEAATAGLVPWPELPAVPEPSGPTPTASSPQSD